MSMAPSAHPGLRVTSHWSAVAILAICAFTIVTTELAPIGLLTPLATEFGQSDAVAGLIVTAYAWIAAIAALLSVGCLRRIARKPLLIGLMLVLALSSVIACRASLFSTLLAARIVGAVAHGAFWAMIGSIGAQLVPTRRIGLATAIIFGGVSAASVLGVPAANLLAHYQGWRSAFIAVAILALMAAMAIAYRVPSLPASEGPAPGALSAVMADPLFRRLFAATACAITAHFAAFTYIEPLLSTALNLPAARCAPLLLLFGLAGIGGNLICGKLLDRHLKTLIVAALMLMAAALMTLGTTTLVVGSLLSAWGAGVAVVFVGFQTWVLRAAGAAALPASAIYVAIFNAAIGTGALVGAALLVVLPLNGLMLAAALACALSLLPVWWLKVPA